MHEIVFIRHGRTLWNVEKRIQGRRDIALTAQAADDLAGRRLPVEFRRFDWVSSPLGRAVHTARLLGAAAPALERRLCEMDWGDWEGRKLSELRTRFGDEMTANEARGLDFRPPGGESPRDVRTRLEHWLRDRSGNETGVVAVAHKGVIRAALSLATGWDMRDKPPHKLQWDAAHLFAWDATRCRLDVVRLNIAFEAV